MGTTRDMILAQLDQDLLKQERLLGLTKAYRRAVLARENTVEQLRAVHEAKVALQPQSCVVPEEAKSDDRNNHWVGKANVQEGVTLINDIRLTKEQEQLFKHAHTAAKQYLDITWKKRGAGYVPVSMKNLMYYLGRYIVFFEEAKTLEKVTLAAVAANSVKGRKVEDDDLL